jgi:hypothetical protein
MIERYGSIKLELFAAIMVKGGAGGGTRTKNKQSFKNPLLSHYPPTTQEEPLHYSWTPIASDGLEHLSSTRHYPSITNPLLTHYSLTTRSLALVLS